MPLSTTTTTTSMGRAPARAALAGNPSDAFGGAVLATVVAGLEARVELSDDERVVVGDCTWPDLTSLCEASHDGDDQLVSATIAHMAAWIAAERGPTPDGGLRAAWSTTIPRSVGLGGSSALVIATMRALLHRWQRRLDDHTGPRLALEVEVDRLGIAAGPQDRVVQWHDRTVLMDFTSSPWSVTAIDPPEPLELFVVWTTRAATSSQATHAPLRERGDEPAVRAAMDRLASLAHEGAAALAAGDRDGLGAAMDASFDERARCIDLHPDHVALVDGARAAGACVNFTGSGGAVVGIAPDLTAVRTWATAAGHGFRLLTLEP